jgi:hypothetical protein
LPTMHHSMRHLASSLRHVALHLRSALLSHLPSVSSCWCVASCCWDKRWMPWRPLFAQQQRNPFPPHMKPIRRQEERPLQGWRQRHPCR